MVRLSVFVSKSLINWLFQHITDVPKVKIRYTYLFSINCSKEFRALALIILICEVS